VFPLSPLETGQSIVGPAIIEQEDTTTLILPRWTATVDRIGTIIATQVV
jgi:N-methylhydantoinase A